MLKKNWNTNIICPVCAAVRERPQLSIPRFYWMGVGIGAMLLAGATTYLTANHITLSVVVATCSGMLCFVGGEVYYTVRFRRDVQCPVCHFDPVKYRRSPEVAKQECLNALRAKEALLQGRKRGFESRREGTHEVHG